MTRIKGATRKILTYIRAVLEIEEGEWDLHILTNFKSIGELMDVDGRVKGAHVVVVNKGGGELTDGVLWRCGERRESFASSDFGPPKMSS